MSIKLFVLAVLCCGTLNASVNKVDFSIIDTKHTSITDRELVFTCSYTTSLLTDKPTVEISNTIYGYKALFTQEFGQEGWVRHVPGEIEEITYNRTNTDNHLVTFKVINPKKVANEYKCKVFIDQYNSKESDLIQVYSQTEIINYDITAAKTQAHEYNISDTLNTYCTYSLPTQETFVKLEFLKENDTYFEYISDTKHTAFYGQGIDKYAIELDDAQVGKVKLNIKNSVADTQGKFLCRITYKNNQKEQVALSEPIMLKLVSDY